MNDPRHLRFGTSLEEWIQGFPAELPRDAVGLWQISNTLRRGFELSEAAFQVSMRKSVKALLDAGAVPVFGSSEDRQWHLATEFGGTADVVVEAVMTYLQSLGREPDFGDLWFALPAFVEARSGA
jgi:hypothetical protein